MKLVRGSEVSSFLRCRKQWKYSWIDNLEPIRQDNKLFFGNLAHKFLEIYYNHLRNGKLPADQVAFAAMEAMFKETDTSAMSQVELDELWDLATQVTDNYVKQWHHIDKDWTVIATELRFAIPLDDDTVYEGTIDLVFLDKDGRLVFMDHKNTSSIDRYTNMVEMDRQISRYWWALEQLARGNGWIWNTAANNWIDINIEHLGKLIKGKEPSGFIYNIILRDYPTVPEQLKKGGLSKAKNQKTTYKIYLQAMDKAGYLELKEDGSIDYTYQAAEDYQEILDHLKAQETEFGNRFFRRIPVVRNENEVQAAMQEFLAVVHDMESVRINADDQKAYGESAFDRTYRNINADCSWCNYRALCVAELDGSHADMIKNLAYRQKEIKDNGKLFR
jgi:hypothetical protein